MEALLACKEEFSKKGLAFDDYGGFCSWGDFLATENECKPSRYPDGGSFEKVLNFEYKNKISKSKPKDKKCPTQATEPLKNVPGRHTEGRSRKASRKTQQALKRQYGQSKTSLERIQYHSPNQILFSISALQYPKQCLVLPKVGQIGEMNLSPKVSHRCKSLPPVRFNSFNEATKIFQKYVYRYT